MDSNLVGQIAAIATSCVWTFSSILFTESVRKIGSLSLNAYRIVSAVGFLGVTHIILLGALLPAANSEQVFWLGISGIVGLGIGDFGLFAAFAIIGPRRSVLVMALSPIFASIGAFLMLGEIVSPQAILGIATTIAGVTWVVLEREHRSMEAPISRRFKIRGVLFALVGAIGQGMGLVFSKKGILLNPDIALNALSATLIRMTFGALFVWISIIAAGRFPDLRIALNRKQGMKYAVAAAFFGPFIGVTLSMVAVTFTQTGVAQTLMSLMPVFIIPVVWVLYKQRISWRGILGAAIAVIGVAILFLT
ncbi:MAG: DMT family transporter [Candidatus Bathyarchaeota archaeon]|nr:DMT family transporter [Candidatus Bathyarchaeota archaeon]